MKINLADFIRKTGTQVALSESERAKMRGVLSEYMAMKPVRAAADANRAPLNAPHAWYFFMRKPLALTLIAVLALSVSGAGVSYAAEKALPGDILYSVKVGVNEPVEAALARTPEAKAAVAAKRAVARLSEASALAAQGKLTPATEEKLASAFAVQADAASAHVDELKANDSPAAIAVASDVESEFAAHVEVLDQVSPQAARTLRTIALAKAKVFSGIRSSAETENDVSEPSPAVAVAFAKEAVPMAFMGVRATSLAAPAQEDSVTATSSASVTPSEAGKGAALRMGTSAKAALTDADALFVKLSSKLSSDEIAQATSTIANARTGTANGDAAFAAGEYAGAFHAYQDAFVSLKKLEVFVKTSARDGIRLHTQVFPLQGEAEGEDVSSVSGSGSSSHEDASMPGVFPPALQILPTEGNN